MPSFSEFWPILFILLLLLGARKLPGLAKSTGAMAGKTVRGTTRKVRWFWSSLSGSEEVSIREERAMGREMAETLLKQEPVIDDPALKVLLDEITAKLSNSKRTRTHRFEVTCIASEQPNACALPGGFLFITAPLVALTRRDPDELAAVIAHEMSHVILRHSFQRVWRQLAIKTVSLTTPVTRAIAPWVQKVGYQWFKSAYSREMEFEADELGLKLTEEAGHDPMGFVRALEHFRDASLTSDGAILDEYFSTHPPINDRIQRLTSLIAHSSKLRATSSDARLRADA